MSAKESYYAALEKQTAGETTIKERFERAREEDRSEMETIDTLYAEIGMKAFQAFHGCLDWLSRIGTGAYPRSAPSSPSTSGDASLDGRFEQLQREFVQIRERIDRLDTSLTTIEAGLRRIDKFTLEAFRNLHEVEERLQSRGAAGLPDQTDQAFHGRLPKEEAAKLAIEAAQKMRAEGRRLTLAAIAREAGLKYGQIVYAFGNKDGFFKALEEVDAKSMERTLDAGA